jgi:hypothetical protein
MRIDLVVPTITAVFLHEIAIFVAIIASTTSNQDQDQDQDQDQQQQQQQQQ